MKKLINRLLKYLAEGLLIILPLTCTVLFIIYAFIKFQQALALLINYIPLLSGLAKLPGVNILTVLLAMILIGYMSTNFIVRHFINFFEYILMRIPILGLVYSYTKESTSGFLGRFDTPVLVMVNAALEIEKVGFLTQKNLKSLHAEDKVAVYFPYSYSFAGETIIVSSAHVKVLEGVSTTDLFRFALTGGLAEIKQPLVLKK